VGSLTKQKQIPQVNDQYAITVLNKNIDIEFSAPTRFWNNHHQGNAQHPNIAKTNN
jgi:hypothetical protein